MTDAYLNRIATAVPAYEVHDFFLRFAASQLGGDPRRRAVFRRMADRAGIRHRFSVIPATEDPEGPVIDSLDLFRRGRFPSTAQRMDLFERTAPALAGRAVAGLALERERVTHLIVTSCTGFSAPGLDLEIVERAGLDPGVERTQIGFMGCYAAVNALKLARHIVRSEPGSQVLCVNLELCTIHLKETTDLEQLLTFALWGDGCAAALVSAEPLGLRLDSFRALLADNSRALMSWAVRDDGFDMVLSGAVPGAIAQVLETRGDEVLGEIDPAAIDLWAVHPGGRSVLDAVERTLKLDAHALADSRAVLHDTGNMSSATVMFVLERLLRRARPGERGCGMAFGPGLTAETFRFTAA